MKTFLRYLTVLGLVFSISCRDTKKEEAEIDSAVEQIDAIEAETETIEKEIEEDAKALEDALNDLEI
ncbi:hypothetical protein [Winogradskyella sp. R77965]|uniref:hypothetical protein n=1 Tax=Winogradskyella sp. R77965 TaxID=3093872 RepID=UPI0037DD36AA